MSFRAAFTYATILGPDPKSREKLHIRQIADKSFDETNRETKEFADSAGRGKQEESMRISMRERALISLVRNEVTAWAVTSLNGSVINSGMQRIVI